MDILRPAVLALRKFGPYALLELVMPGGTILALLLYLYRHRREAGAGCRQPYERAANAVGRWFGAYRSIELRRCA
jgi:hypothetical protein